MGRIKQILLQQYIGAIVVGILAADAVGALISGLLQPVTWYFVRRPLETAFPGTTRPLSWEMAVPSVVSAVLYLAAAYLLLRWLYLHPQPTPAEAEEEDAGK